MATKAELQAMVEQLLAKQNAATPAAPVPVAFAVAETVAADTFIDAVARSTDDVGLGSTLRDAVIAFAVSVPSLAGKPLPDSEADRMADKLESKYKAAYPPGTDFSAKSSAANSVKSRKTKARTLFQCAPILPDILKQVAVTRVDDIRRLCTQLKKNKFDVPATMAARAAAATATPNFAASAVMHMGSILGMQSEEFAFLSAVAKAKLVLWCDTYGLKGVKHADLHRNPNLV